MQIDMEKISAVLVQPVNDLTLKVHSKLLREKEGRKENFHNEFTFNNNNYLKLDLQSFLTLELRREEWSKDKSIIINQRNIFQIITKFKSLLESIYNGGVFALNKDNEIVIYKDKVEEYTQKIYNLGGNQRMLIKPAIIYDENEVSYEGVILYLNKTENYAQLPIDAFESLVYTLDKVDLFLYSQLLVNYYMSYLSKKSGGGENNSSKQTTTKSAHPCLVEEPETKGNIFKKPSEKEIFGFDK